MALNIDQDMAKAIKLAQAGKLKPAIDILLKLTAMVPASIPLRYNLALFLLMAGRHAEALPHLDRILAQERRPSYPDDLNAIAHAQLRDAVAQVANLVIYESDAVVEAAVAEACNR